MKFIKVLHYAKYLYEGNPAFVLLMEDDNGVQREYIQTHFEFLENTKPNIDFLIDEYECEDQLNTLFNSPPIEISELEDGR